MRKLFIYLIYVFLDSGKTAMAATIGIESDFPYVKIVSSFICLGNKYICDSGPADFNCSLLLTTCRYLLKQ